MEKTLRAGYYQFPVTHQKEENLARIAKRTADARGALLVLPELCLCGYLFDDRDALLAAAEPVPDGASVRALLALSASAACTLVCGLAEREENRIYNTAVIVSCGRYLGKYRKIHLSDFEKRFFDAGDPALPDVFSLNGLRIGVQICFDLWFPEIARRQMLAGADILCVPAAFGGETSHLIAPARAAETLTPLILCNRTGHEVSRDLDASFLGRSGVFDASGRLQNPDCPEKEQFFLTSVVCGTPKGNIICRDFPAEIALHRQTRNDI